jgi:hypothetical protein
MERVFLSSRTDGWALDVVDAEGKVSHSVAGEYPAGLTGARDKSGERRVFVVWQAEGIVVPGGFYGKRAVVDLYHVAWTLVECGVIEDRSLESLAKWCSVSYSDKTHADRVRVVRECYLRTVERLRIGLKVEDVGRTLASGLADKAMQVFGKLAT